MARTVASNNSAMNLPETLLKPLVNFHPMIVFGSAGWGLTHFPDIYRAQRDTALVNEILASVRGRR